MTKATHSEFALIAKTLQKAIIERVLPGEGDAIDAVTSAAMASFMAEVASVRAKGVSIVDFDAAREGKPASATMRIAIVNDDMPFLVDSIANCLAQMDIQIHRLTHPVMVVKRDLSDRLIAVSPANGGDSTRESLICLEVDWLTARKRQELARELLKTLAHVRAAVTDWPRLQLALGTDAENTGDVEGAALLRWLLARNMTQTGYERRNRAGKAEGSLGICRIEDEPVLAPASVKAAFDWFEQGGSTPLIVKSNRTSRVHRSSLLDLFILPVRDGKHIIALSIHVGMWTSAALATAPDKIPVLRAALSTLMDKYGFSPSGHAGKALYHALTTLPHDILIGFDRPTLERLALTLMSLSDRPRPRLVLASAPLSRHLYAFVWLPRDDVSTARRVAIQDMLVKASNAPLLSWSIALDEAGLALLRITLDLRDGGTMPDETLLDRQVKHMLRGWLPAVEAALADIEEPARATALAEKYAGGFPPSYRFGAGAEEAALDINELQQLVHMSERRIRIYRNAEDSDERMRLKLYSLSPIALSDAVPALENFGFRAIEEMTTAIDGGALGHIQRFLLAVRDGGDARALLGRSDLLSGNLADVLMGVAEDDRFNELIVSTGLDARSVVLFRALFRYLRQTGMPYAMATFVDALRKQRAITHALVDLFAALHGPACTGDRAAATDTADQAILHGLTQVTAIDEDRILRLLRAVIQATLRTNFFVPAGREALAFKLDSAKVPGLPAPLPWREIWVYSPRVEGIHLRAGPVARGGLRWSDRRDDFRTEVLGLMKAQRVKNAVIVPTGAKGGFYPKQLPNPQTDRDAWLAEGTESYRLFIRTLLSVTDNIVGGKVKHPPHVIIRDGDDPYFVVAADKGTATFSDVANAIALDHKFWLGDAFASGGSNGYDHKAMGITARGAWLSVQRHFAEMGLDVQSESVRVVGCGDMSGDVFGNGMLLSKAIKLVAAFDHRHIFIDPDPDPAASWEERNRLFALPRSSWEDYDKALISRGGGVFARSLKSITLTPELQAIIGTAETEMDPASLISALLRAPFDLLWFGGIGTYVKAAAQSNGEVGDPANDALRINAEELGVKVIGEGANLGTTQAARIAFALKGGRINTDFIDNSAGVDCSDNEVNIKIALNQEMAQGRLPFEARNMMLVQMTDAVAHLVLEDNRLQALGLSIAQAGGAASLASYVRLIETFEASEMLDRKVEGLASNDQLLRRAQDGMGLTRPELAVLLSTAKLSLQAAIEHGNLASDANMDAELARAFPPLMQEKEAAAINTHQLRAEIIATKIANRIINRLGLVHPFELVEEEGCSLGEMANAFVIAEHLYDVDRLWTDIDAANMPEAARLALLGNIARAMRAQMADILRALPMGTLPDAGEAMLKQGVHALMPQVDGLLTDTIRLRTASVQDNLVALGASEDLAARVVTLLKMDGAVGLANLAKDGDGLGLARAFVRLGEGTGIDWLQSTAARLEPSDPWERLLISGIARDMQQVRFDLLARMGTENAPDMVEEWLAGQTARVAQFRQLMQRAQSAPTPHVAMLAELAGQARGLLLR
ncbi:MAG: NAD-glutamate dehydrogenase domain-containing protein [Sphingobium sp.]